MFKSIINLFKKNKKTEDYLDIPTIEVTTLEDVTYENEVKKKPTKETKETKETKSTLTFGK